MKRGYCIHCQNADDKKRIFEVNTDSKVCFCPHCMHKYTPLQAVNNYNRMMMRYLIKANYFLKNAMIIDKAYALFGYILEIEPTNLQAKIGRIVSLCYLSTLRKEYFLDAKALMDIDKDRFHGVNIAPFYLEMLKEINNCLDVYLKGVYKKLTLKDHFYDIDCVELYFNRLQTIREMKNYLLNEAVIVHFDELEIKIKQDIEDLDNKLKQPLYTFDGNGHALIKKNKTKKPVLVSTEENDGVNLEKYHPQSLVYQSHNIKVIKDKVFKNYRKLHTAKMVLIPVSFINLFIALAFLVTYFIINSSSSKPLAIFGMICLYATIAVAVMALFGFVSRLLISKSIKKTRI